MSHKLCLRVINSFDLGEDLGYMWFICLWFACKHIETTADPFIESLQPEAGTNNETSMRLPKVCFAAFI